MLQSNVRKTSDETIETQSRNLWIKETKLTVWKCFDGMLTINQWQW